MTLTLLAQGIVKRYGGVIAVKDGHLEVQSGVVVTLVGANGSGKSTLSKVNYSSTACRSSFQHLRPPKSAASQPSIKNSASFPI